MAKNFRDLERQALADRKRRANFERERTLLGATPRTVHVVYAQDQDTWVASSPEVPSWTVVADSYDEAHQLVEEGVRIALNSGDVELKHLAP